MSDDLVKRLRVMADRMPVANSQMCSDAADRIEEAEALPSGRKPLGDHWFLKHVLPKVTRVEVIDSNGRIYTQYDAKDVWISVQDDERTLKVFLKNE